MSDNPTTESLAVGTRAVIQPGGPLPGFDSVGARAFGGHSKEGGGSPDLLAYLCDKNIPARYDVLTTMSEVNHPAILRLIDSGVVAWPDGKRYLALALQRPMNSRLKGSIDEPHQPIPDDFLATYFITPMVGALRELQRNGLVHHAIRPTNIFWRIGGTSAAQLGECVSVPAGYGQPTVFETIERAMAHPLGRGTGTHADDCYAFGVTLALLIFGGNPMQGLDDATIIRAKMERGTFGTLVGNRRVPPAHVEILRGLLADDPRQRWNGSDLEQWLHGRAPSKNADAAKRAERSYEFLGEHYWQPRPLANALVAHVAEAVPLIENNSLVTWLRRGLNDEARANHVAKAQDSLKQGGRPANYEEQLVARVALALDPTAPLRYRGLSVMPMGFAALLLDMVAKGQNIQTLSEIISSQLLAFAITLQPEMRTDMAALNGETERMKSLLEKAILGSGIERVAYEINPAAPCLSPIVASQFAMNGASMLTGLERVASLGDRAQEPMDRHIAAFLLAREKRGENLFEIVTVSSQPAQRGLALLSIYASLQERYGPPSLPYLAQWLLPQLELALQRFLGKAIKENMREQVKQAAKQGSLGALLRLVDDPRWIQRDQQDFMAARLLYLNIMKEVSILENRIANRDAVVKETGKPMAASISTLIAIVMVFAAILHAIWRVVFQS